MLHVHAMHAHHWRLIMGCSTYVVHVVHFALDALQHTAGPPRSTASVCCPDEAPQSRVIELSHDVCKSLTHRLAQSCCMTSPSHPHGIKVLIRNKGASLDAGTELTQSKVCRSVTPFFMGRSVGSGLVMMVQPDGEPGRRDWAQSAVCLTGREVCS